MRLRGRLQMHHWAFWFSVVFCLAANLLPYNDLGNLPSFFGRCEDCIYYLGRPFAFHEQGGDMWRRKLYMGAFATDVAIALTIIVATTFAIQRRR